MKIITVGIKMESKYMIWSFLNTVSFRVKSWYVWVIFNDEPRATKSLWSSKVTNKSIVFYDDDQIADFPLGNGSQSEIVGRNESTETSIQSKWSKELVELEIKLSANQFPTESDEAVSILRKHGTFSSGAVKEEKRGRRLSYQIQKVISRFEAVENKS